MKNPAPYLPGIKTKGKREQDFSLTKEKKQKTPLKPNVLTRDGFG
jgi:hypothetical protein